MSVPDWVTSEIKEVFYGGKVVRLTPKKNRK